MHMMYFKNMIYINIKENKYCLKLGEKKKRNVGVVVKNLPANAGDEGLIPGLGTKIPHALDTH